MASNATEACFAVDATFGPWAGPDCRGGFDFTLLFQETILSILPLSLLLAVAPFRIFFLWRKRIKVHKTPLLLAKLVSYSYVFKVNNKLTVCTDIMGSSRRLRNWSLDSMGQEFDGQKSGVRCIERNLSPRSLRTVPFILR